jgi:asparaginyl-tRNA synthetase
MKLDLRPMTRIRARVESVRRHKTISFISAFDPFQKDTIQLKAQQGICKIIGSRGSVFEADIDPNDENMIINVLWAKHPAEVHSFFSSQPRPNSLCEEVSLLQKIIYDKKKIIESKAQLLRSLREFFASTNILESPGPIITTNDCEGGGEAFEINNFSGFFSEEAFLTVSAQLHLELACSQNSGVYSLGPVFRAEKHDTKLHLAEFWMAEVELPFITDMSPLMSHCSGAIKKCILDLEGKCSDLKILENLRKEPKIVTYDDAIGIIAQQDPSFLWGMALKSSHELMLSRYLGDHPLFIVNYPMDIKPFYMKHTIQNGRKIAICFDFIVPNVGEVAGGSLRETDPDILVSNMELKRVDKTKLDWYVGLRKLGHPPTGGYGIGVERLLLASLGLSNIRDAILFPRSKGSLRF